MLRNQIISNFDEKFYEYIENFKKEFNIPFNLNETFVFGDILSSSEAKEINIYLNISIELKDCPAQYQQETLKIKNKYKDNLNFDGEILIYRELNNFLKNKIKEKLGLNIKFAINDKYTDELSEFEDLDFVKLEDFLKQNYQKKILFDKLELSNSKTLNINNSEEAKERFINLAYSQRGLPEEQMKDIQMYMGGGVLTNQIEHIGDLTHRIAQRTYIEGLGIECALGDIRDKINNAIRTLSRKDNGFIRELQSNLEGNYKCKEESLDTFKEKCFSMLKTYSDYHSELEVYNIFQYNSREAAVKLGKLDFEGCLSHLITLNKIIENDDFVKLASTYDPNYEKNNIKNINKKRIKPNR